MIVLDTNVLSALMRTPPDPVVLEWLDDQRAQDIWTTSITVFEVRFGLALLAPGRRRRGLADAFDALLREDLENRVLDFDTAAADAAARIAASARAAGRPADIRDTQIAGVVAANRAALATRNTAHFAFGDFSIINPWDTPLRRRS